jgi:hypothetical protein
MSQTTSTSADVECSKDDLVARAVEAMKIKGLAHLMLAAGTRLLRIFE